MSTAATRISHGKRRLRDLAATIGPAGLVPVVVLLGLGAVEGFDDTAFGVLGPEIRSAFHLSSAGYITIATLTSVLPLLLAVPMGFVGDRFNRVRLSRGGALLWGLAAVATGLAPAVWFLVLTQMGGGIGELVNTPVHGSLLSDYYPPEALPTAYGTYQVGSGALVLMAAPVAGVLGALFGWRATFVILAIPSFVMVALAARLREPVRGASIDAVMPDEELPTIGEGFRRVRAIRSLRRTWAAAFLFGGAVVPFGNILNLFYKDVYHFGPAARGFVTALFSGLGLVGIVLGALLAKRVVRRGKPEQLPAVMAVLVAEYAAGIVLMAIAPTAALSIAAVAILSVGSIAFLPAYQSLVAMVSPPRLRAQAFAWSLLWYAAGALVIGASAGAVGDDHGQRVALGMLAGVLGIGAAVEWTAQRFVSRDIEQARTFREAETSEALVACRGVEVAYDGVQVLFGVDLEVREGELLAILGTNGSGKSTLLNTIAGLLDPVGGSIFWEGRDITHADATVGARLGMALVPGGRGVFPDLTVAENIRAAGWLLRKDPTARRRVQAEVCAQFPILQARWEVAAGTLSGGEQQLLSLAQAFVAQPRLLLIDELTLGLSPAAVDQIVEAVQAIHARGTTVVVVEQSIATALRLAKRAVFLEKGEVRFTGATSTLRRRPDLLRSVFLPAPSSPPNGKAVARKEDERRGQLLWAPTAMEVQGLAKHYGGVAALVGVDLEIHEGEIVGIIGANGAGKTTLLDVMSGFVPPDRGSIFVGEVDVTRWSAPARADAGLGRLFQDARMWPSLTVTEALAVACERRVEVRAIIPAAFRLPVVAESEAEVADTVAELLALFGLEAFRDKFVSELSTGSRRMVELAALIAHRPSVALLDEPSSGIAQGETEALGPLLRQVRAHLGCAMAVIEHDLGLIAGVADRLVVLDQGRVVASGPPASVLADGAVLGLYLGKNPKHGRPHAGHRVRARAQ